MNEVKNNKSIKKQINEPNAKPRSYTFLVLLALFNFVLISISFAALYFVLFIEIKDLRSQLNLKLSESKFLSEKKKMEKLQVTDLNSEKEYLLSKINSVNDLLKTNSENLDNKIKEIRLDYLEFKESGTFEEKGNQTNNQLPKNELSQLNKFQLKLQKELGSLQERISMNEKLVDKNKRDLLALSKSYQNRENRETLEMSKEFLGLIEEFGELSYEVLKSEVKSHKSQNWNDWVKSYISAIFISRSTQPIDGEHTDAILSRIDNALKGGNLKVARDEINNLPGGSKSTMKDWIEKLDKLIKIEDQRNQ